MDPQGATGSLPDYEWRRIGLGREQIEFRTLTEKEIWTSAIPLLSVSPRGSYGKFNFKFG